MSLRVGHRVRFKVEEYEQNETESLNDPNTALLRGLGPSPADELIQRLREDPTVEATITGLIDGGEWANLRFDDDFECGCPTKFIERASK